MLKRMGYGVLTIACGVLFSLPASALEVGDEAPCVVLKGLDAGKVETEGCIRETTQESQKYTIVEFFSIDCGACQRNIPRLSQLHGDITKNAAVRLVSLDREVDRVRDFVTTGPYSLFINFPVAFDNERDATKAYGIFATPTLFVLNKDNIVVYKHVGLLSADNLKEIKAIVKN